MQKRRLQAILVIMVVGLFLSGCGTKKGKTANDNIADMNQEDTAAEGEEKQGNKLFAVTAIDTNRKILTLYDCETRQEKPYNYNGATYIHDKYGGSMTIGQLSQGELVTIESSEDMLVDVRVSDEAFRYDDLHNFTLDQENKTLTVGGSTYFFDDSLLIYQDSSKLTLSEISEYDTICLRGMDKKIYTIQIMTGHGTVVLENEDVFLGGYITIGNLMSVKV